MFFYSTTVVSYYCSSWRICALPARNPSAFRNPFRRGHLVDMEEETTRELSALQRERELLQAKEKENRDAIDEVHV